MSSVTSRPHYTDEAHARLGSCFAFGLEYAAWNAGLIIDSIQKSSSHDLFLRFSDARLLRIQRRCVSALWVGESVYRQLLMVSPPNEQWRRAGSAKVDRLNEPSCSAIRISHEPPIEDVYVAEATRVLLAPEEAVEEPTIRAT